MRIKGSHPQPKPKGPGSPESLRSDLRADPEICLPVAWFPTKQQAVDAAKRFERGERVVGGWSPDEFYACWKRGSNPDEDAPPYVPAEGEELDGEGWLVLFGHRSGMDEDWARYWEKFRDLRARRLQQMAHAGT